MNSCTQTVTLGAYLLGALEPPERYEFEAHISGCDNCRTELVRLAPLPGMLNQIMVEDFDEDLPPGELYPTAPMPIQTMLAPAPQLTLPPPELLLPREEPVPPPPADPPPGPPPAGPPDTVDLAGRRNRRLLRMTVAAAAVLAVVFGGVLGWQALREPPAADAPGITWTATAPDSDVRADVELIEHEWGTELQISMSNTPPGRGCYVMVFDHYGNREVSGWWRTDHVTGVQIPASTSIQRSKIDRLEFKLDDKVTFLTVSAPVG